MLRLVRALPLGALLGASFTGCFFPDYTFPGGGGGATSTVTSTTGTTSSTGGSGGSAPKEDCFNGIDDDADGLADCADPDCAPDTECVGPIPVGWGTFGYVVLAEGDPNAQPTCPSYAVTSKYTGNNNLLGGSWSCDKCKCDPPTGQACDLTDLNSVKAGVQPFQIRDVPCATQNATTIREVSVPNAPWDLMCFAGAPVDSIPGNQVCPGGACNQSVTSLVPTVSGGSCMPNGGAPVLTTPTWEVGATVCGDIAQMSGCSGTDKCMPKPSAPFSGRVCVGKAGDQTCPAGPFTKKHLYYGSFDDTRGCDMCHCNGPVGGACTLQITLYSDNACTTGLEVKTFNAGSCGDLSGNPTVGGRQATMTQAPAGGACSPTVLNPAKTGGVTEGSPTTFCCLP